MKKICLTCKKEFDAKDKRQKYCSFACVYDKRSERNNIIRKLKTGIKYSEEYKKKMSERCKGLNTWRKGQKMPLTAIKKISEFQKGKKWRLGCRDTEKTKIKKSLARQKEKNPNWQGGKSFEKYNFEWTDILREAIRKRDNYICHDCGILQTQLKGKHQKLDIHHKNNNKTDCEYSNLISLCKSCHQKKHHK